MPRGGKRAGAGRKPIQPKRALINVEAPAMADRDELVNGMWQTEEWQALTPNRGQGGLCRWALDVEVRHGTRETHIIVRAR